MNKRKNWEGWELTLALNLYSITPYSRISARNPDIIELAHTIGRTPGAVSYKLANFASLDRKTIEANKKGFTNGGKLDKVIWDRYTDQEGYLQLTELLEASLDLIEPLGLKPKYLASLMDPLLPTATATTEVLVLRRERVNQNYFRQAVLANYNQVCAITGCRISSLIEAAHILPWSEFPESRMTVSNGLALNSFLHKLYDKNLMGISEEGQVFVAPTILKNNALGSFTDFFTEINRTKINFDKVLHAPKQEFLWHKFSEFREFNRNL